MLIDPISGLRMRKARARGGHIWYCPQSRSRLLTVVAAKHFLSEDGVREIWVRSGLATNPSEYRCPSCTKPMNLVAQPGWLGEGLLNLCRRCHLIWVMPDQHPGIPHPEDLLTERGDSTVVGDVAKAKAELLVHEHQEAEDQKRFFGEGPPSVWRRVATFFLLPGEMSEHGYPSSPWVSWLLMVICFAVFMKHDSQAVVNAFGLWPDEPLRNGGLNFLTGAFIHVGVFHFIFNMYFFNMFADDVEHDLGMFRYILFFLLLTFMEGLFVALFAQGPSRSVPHVGLSGVVMGLMIYYALQFPKARLAYIFPFVHYLSVGRGGYVRLSGVRWLRLPVWSVAVFYFAVDFFFYWSTANSGHAKVSYVGHLGGFVSGVVLWAAMSKKVDPEHDLKITGERDVTPGRNLFKVKKNLLKSPKS